MDCLPPELKLLLLKTIIIHLGPSTGYTLASTNRAFYSLYKSNKEIFLRCRLENLLFTEKLRLLDVQIIAGIRTDAQGGLLKEDCGGGGEEETEEKKLERILVPKDIDPAMSALPLTSIPSALTTKLINTIEKLIYFGTLIYFDVDTFNNRKKTSTRQASLFFSTKARLGQVKENKDFFTLTKIIWVSGSRFGGLKRRFMDKGVWRLQKVVRDNFRRDVVRRFREITGQSLLRYHRNEDFNSNWAFTERFAERFVRCASLDAIYTLLEGPSSERQEILTMFVKRWCRVPIPERVHAYDDGAQLEPEVSDVEIEDVWDSEEEFGCDGDFGLDFLNLAEEEDERVITGMAGLFEE